MRRFDLLLVALLALPLSSARAEVGLTQITGGEDTGPVTIFYPSSGVARTVERGPFTFRLAEEGTPQRGNGRLVVVSHGSGGSPWVNADLARTLVEAGFVVAMPEHHADNFKDASEPGPDSWKRRPKEVSNAIDKVAGDPRFAPLLELDRVGVYGMSAGGHTALTLAGGRWSPLRLREHCDAHIAEDFQACVGLTTQLDGGLLDGAKKTIAVWVIRMRFDDPTWYSYEDPRVAAAVAGVPFAADFDPASLSAPRVPLALVTARRDEWLVPRFHSDPILEACSGCKLIADLPTGGHGALLSPPPPLVSGLVGELLSDPPGFDRTQIVEVDKAIADFFVEHLVDGPPS